MTSNLPPTGTTLAPARQATLREFFAVLFRRRWIVLGLLIATTATVVIVSLTTKTSYMSSGKVLVSRGERESALSGQVSVLNDWEQDLASEVAKVRSDEVQKRTTAMLEERARRTGRKAPPFLPARVDIEVMGKSNVLAIGYSDRSPDVAQEVCDALLTAYVDYRQSRRLTVSDAVFEAEMKHIEEQIAVKLQERESYSARLGGVDPVEQGRSLSQQVALLEARRNETEADLSDAQASLRAMRALHENPDIDLPMLGVQYANENALVTLKTKITDQQTRVATLRERYRDDSPEVQNAVSTLETLRALLRREVDARLSLAQSRIDVLQSRLGVHLRDIAGLRTRMEAIPQTQKAIDDLTSDVAMLRKRYEDYAHARDQARITANTTSAVNITLLNPAGAAAPSNTRDYVRLALAPAFSLVVGVGLAFFLDGLDPTVHTPAQAEQFLELPVLATLPERRRSRG